MSTGRGGWVPPGEWAKRVEDGRAADRRTTETARRMLAGQRRALSVQRPWANLIAAGLKPVENRTWTHPHRGEVWVHAGQAWDPAGAELADQLGLAGFATRRECPTGYLATVRLLDIHPAAGAGADAVCCAPWGQPGPDTYHWQLADPAPFPTPIPGPGRLGLYWLPVDQLPRH